MTVKHLPTVQAYEQNHAKAVAVLENLLEFVNSMPAPQGSQIENVDYGYTGSFAVVVEMLEEASRITDAMSQ